MPYMYVFSIKYIAFSFLLVSVFPFSLYNISVNQMFKSYIIYILFQFAARVVLFYNIYDDE